MRCFRGTLALAMLLAAAYVTLPWWLPTDWLHGRIVSQLQHDLNRKVYLRSVRVSWSEGVVLEDLRIARGPGYGEGDLLRVGRVQAPFTPLRTWLTGHVLRLELSDCDLTVVRDAGGRLNLGELKLPEMSLKFDRFTCDQARVRLINLKSRQNASIDLPDLSFAADPATGRMLFSGAASVAYVSGPGSESTQLGYLSADADILSRPDAATAAGGSVQPGGKVRLSWRTVDLKSLTVHDWQAAHAIGLRRLSGKCGGTLALTLTPQGRIEWTLDARVQEMEVDLASRPHRLHVPAGRFFLEGLYDTPSDTITLGQLRTELPGVDLQASVEYRPNDANVLRLQVADARLRPELIARVSPDLMSWLPPQWRLSGELRLTGKIELADTFQDLNLRVDATDLGAAIPGWVDKPAGRSAELDVQAHYQQDRDRLNVPRISLQIGRSRLTLSAVADSLFPILSGRLRVWDVWLNWLAELDIDAPDASDLLDRLPVLRRAMGDATLAGPVKAQVRFEPLIRERRFEQVVLGRELSASLDFAPQSALRIPCPTPDAPPAIDKPPGRPLALSIRLPFAPDSMTVHDGQLVIREGVVTDADAGRIALAPLSGKLAVSRPPPGQSLQRVDLVLDGNLIGRNVEQFVGLMPCLRDALAENDADLSGGFDGELNVRLGGPQLRTRLRLDLDRLAVRVGGERLLRTIGHEHRATGDAAVPPPAGAILIKRADEPARLEINYSGVLLGQGARSFLPAQIDFAGLGLSLHTEGNLVDLGDPQCATLHIDDVRHVLAHFPVLADELGALKLHEGSADLRIGWLPGEPDDMTLAIDATKLGFSLPAPWGGSKAAGVPLSLNARFTTNLPDGPVSPWINVRRGVVQSGDSRVGFSGLVVLLPVLWGSASPPPIDQVNLKVGGRLSADSQLRTLLPTLADWLDARGVSGGVTFLTQLTGGWEELHLTTDLDARDMAIRIPGGLDKRAGVAAGGRIDLTVNPSGWSLWQINDLRGQLADIAFAASGQARRQTGSLTAANWNLRLDLNVPDLGQLSELFPAILSNRDFLGGPLSGSVACNLHLFDDGQREQWASRSLLGWARMLPSRMDLHDVRCKLADSPVAIDGSLSLSDQAVGSPRLRLAQGPNRVAVAFNVSNPVTHPIDQDIQVVGRHVDIDEFHAFWTRLRSLPWPSADAGPAAALAAPSPARVRTAQAAGSIAVSGARRAFQSVSQPVGPPLRGQVESPEPAPMPQRDTARQITDFAARCDLRGSVHFEEVYVTDSKNQTRYKLSEFTSRFSLDDGLIDFPFQTGMEGGTLDGRVTCNLADEVPLLQIQYEARRLFPTQRVHPLVEAFFPGMTVNGYVTMIEKSHQKLLPDPGEANWPVGAGEIIFNNGMLVGQAAPDWMARIFPGLKWKEYRFDRMHDWFELTADGAARHHMLFDGQSYDIYMIGDTHRGSGDAHYEVGVDLLASLDSKTWSVNLRQGKIPMMYVDGRIVNRELKESKFSMVLPTSALWKMLIENNLIYRAVVELAARKSAQAPESPPAP
ncbi:MAG: hypothetical protein BIFFINMI_01222 [Phycisphaerae bacterium]|nr:hypothetical protein [Phycisphaerae bacterium]